MLSSLSEREDHARLARLGGGESKFEWSRRSRPLPPHHHPHPHPRPPPPPGPPSQSSMEDYNQKSSSHRRSRHPRRTGGTTSRPRWTTRCLET